MANNQERERLMKTAMAGGEEDTTASILASPPAWGSISECAGAPASLLTQLHGKDSASQFALCDSAKGSIADTIAACLRVADPAAATYALTLFVDIARTNSAFYNLVQPASLYDPLAKFLAKAGISEAAADKAAYLLTALLWQAGSTAPKTRVADAAKLVLQTTTVSEVGAIDALVNLLKHTELRVVAWSVPGVRAKVSDITADTPVPLLYKCCFALWMVSCEASLLEDLKDLGAHFKIKKAISTNRNEKVIRVALQCLKNMLGSNVTAEDVLDAGALEAVDALQYEKWRDAEVYEMVKSVSKSVHSAVAEHSNFLRYENEVKKKSLTWGFIHSEKFWVENYMSFEKDDYSVVKQLVDIVMQASDAVTLAVALHDIGEFARLHPSGKTVLNRMPSAKAQIMAKMGDSDREVAREALLCTQKLMLNRWQDL